MNKRTLITFLCFSAITPMMAQDIKGKIVDEKGEPLAFANVVLLNRQDSAFVKGVVSGEDGHFAIDSACNNGIIKVTSVGYKTAWKDCTGENAGVIKMVADSMSGSFVPVGPYKSYTFHISVKSSLLSDLKYDKRSSSSNGVTWY